MTDIQKWETYKNFRIVPFLMQFDYSYTEPAGNWIAALVEIRSATDGKLVKTINLNGQYALSEHEAFLLAVKLGKEEIDKN